VRKKWTIDTGSPQLLREVVVGPGPPIPKELDGTRSFATAAPKLWPTARVAP